MNRKQLFTIVFTAIVLSFVAVPVMAQEPVATTAMRSACFIPTKGLSKQARERIELDCKLENATIKAKIAKVELGTKAAELVVVKDAARTVESTATTTVVGEDGGTTTTTSSYSMTPSAAKHDEKTQPIVVNNNGDYYPSSHLGMTGAYTGRSFGLLRYPGGYYRQSQTSDQPNGFGENGDARGRNGNGYGGNREMAVPRTGAYGGNGPGGSTGQSTGSGMNGPGGYTGPSGGSGGSFSLIPGTSGSGGNYAVRPGTSGSGGSIAVQPGTSGAGGNINGVGTGIGRR